MSKATCAGQRDLLDYGFMADLASLINRYGMFDDGSECTVESAKNPYTGRPVYKIKYNLVAYVQTEQGERFIRRNGLA